MLLYSFSGDNVEDVFIETAKKIYQNIQDGKYICILLLIIITIILLLVSVDLNAADTGVQLKPSATGGSGDRKPTGNQSSQQGGGKGCC